MGGGASAVAPGRLLARAKPGSEAAGAVAVAQSGGFVTGSLAGVGVWVVETSAEATEDAHRALQASGQFEFVQHDMVARRATDPDDPQYPQQWHLADIQASSAWTITTGSSAVTIGVLDSGIDSTHPDLAPKTLAGWNFIDETPDTSDTLGHGTMVSGAVAAMTNNAGGVAGVSWDSPILPLVVLDGNDQALYSDIVQAIVYAADRGVRVLNISLAGTTPSASLQSAVDYAWARGTIIVAAAGNGATTVENYPAACDNVIGVSATQPGGALAPFSNTGAWVDLSAPGTSILTTMDGSCYGYSQGTSFACPLVAGVAALVLSVRPDLTNAQVVDVLFQSADDLGDAGYDESYGWGRVNASAAVAAALAYVN